MENGMKAPSRRLGPILVDVTDIDIELIHRNDITSGIYGEFPTLFIIGRIAD